MRFWKDEDKLERELRTSRPEPGDELVTRIAKRLRHVERPRVFLRLGLASGLTAALLVAVASVGGVGQGAHAVGKAVGLSHAGFQLKSSDPQHPDPSHDQYKEQRKQCKKTENDRHHASQQQIEADFKACRDSVDSIHKSHMDAIEQQHKNALAACAKGKPGETCRKNADADYEAAKKTENDNYEAAKKQCEEQHQAAKKAEDEQHRANMKTCRKIGKSGKQH